MTNELYKVTIQSTPVGESNWRVVTTGTWTPGTAPQLEAQTLPAQVIEALLNIVPSPMDESGRNEMQDGNTLYSVVYRRLSR